jgi:hypothetical protein
MNGLWRPWLLLLLLAPLPAARADDPLGDALRQTPDQIRRGIEGQHPAVYYVLAQKLFASGQKDEAVFWFYAGQLRYRFHLRATPGRDPSGDPALFASLSEVIGRPINEYAFGDLDALRATLPACCAGTSSRPTGSPRRMSTRPPGARPDPGSSASTRTSATTRSPSEPSGGPTGSRTGSDAGEQPPSPAG